MVWIIVYGEVLVIFVKLRNIFFFIMVNLIFEMVSFLLELGLVNLVVVMWLFCILDWESLFLVNFFFFSKINKWDFRIRLKNIGFLLYLMLLFIIGKVWWFVLCKILVIVLICLIFEN